jgi:hypothetical protein
MSSSALANAASTHGTNSPNSMKPPVPASNKSH